MATPASAIGQQVRCIGCQQIVQIVPDTMPTEQQLAGATGGVANPAKKKMSGKTIAILGGSIGGGLLILVIVIMLLSGGGAPASCQDLGNTVFSALKADNEQVVLDLGLFSQFDRVKKRILASEAPERDKQRAREATTEKIAAERKRWEESISEDFREARQKLDWKSAKLLVVVDNEGQREPEADIAVWGGRDNVTVFAFFKVSSEVWVLAVDEVVKFENRWYIIDNDLTVQRVRDLSRFRTKSPTFALNKYNGPYKEELLRAIPRPARD